MGDLPIFLSAVAAFAVVGVGIGMLVARRLDRWVTAEDEQPEQPDLPRQPDEPREPEERDGDDRPGDDDRPDA